MEIIDQPQISIVIPCYNGSSFVEETLRSILEQKNQNFEIIFVDDGSTDDTKSKVVSLNESRIRYVYQKNSGVSAARNNGFGLSKGEYVVFFDADDKMEPEFLNSRADYLNKNKNVDFVCGEVQKFNDQGLIPGYFRGTSADVTNEILLYNSEVTSCPSNYMFRQSFLQKNNLLFNTKLSSTADKFFLIQSAKYGKSIHKSDAGKLLYRIVENSMSHKLTEKLVLDNETYYYELLGHGLIPQKIRKNALFIGYFILFSSFWKLSLRGPAIRYAWKAFILKPFSFIWKCFN